jgi:hypothetical protein
VGLRVIGVVVGVAACSGGEPGEPPPDSTDQSGACGDVSAIDVRVVGTVEDGDGAAAGDVDVALVERNWTPGTVHGTARTDAAGAFEMDATGLPVVEGCWGTAVQFWLEGTKGQLSGEKPMNSLIIDAYLEARSEVDLGAFPLVVR